MPAADNASRSGGPVSAAPVASLEVTKLPKDPIALPGAGIFRSISPPPPSRHRHCGTLMTSHAGVFLVRPLQLDCVATHLLGLPGADVTDLTVVVVVPPLSRNRVGDRLAQLM